MSSVITTPSRSVTSDFGAPYRARGSLELANLGRDASGVDANDIISDDQAPDHATEAIPDGGYGWTIVASCSVLLFWVNGYLGAWGVLQTAILQTSRLHTNIRTITFVGSLSMAVVVAFGLVSVKLLNMFGARYASLVGVTLFGLGLVGMSFTLDHLAGLFCISGIVLGCGASLLFTCANTLSIQWFSSKLGTANGLIKGGGGIGAAVLPIASQGLIDKYGMEWTLRILGFLTLATCIPCAWLLKERTRTGAASRYDWSLLKNIPFMALVMAGAVGVFAAYVPPFFLPLFAKSIGLSSSTGAALVAGFGASTALGRLLGGWACDRIGAFNALAITCLINSISMVAIWPVSSSLPPLFIFAIVNGCANGSFFVGLPTAVAALSPSSAATSISLMSSFWTPGYLLGTPVAGVLIDATGAADASTIGPYRAAIFYAAGVGTMATCLVVISRARLDMKLMKKL